MNFWDWLFPPRRFDPRDSKANVIAETLFPSLEPSSTTDGTKFLVDRSVDTNLLVALEDVRAGHTDLKTQATIGDVLERLTRVRNILGAYSEFDVTKYNYVVVETVRRVDPEPEVKGLDF